MTLVGRSVTQRANTPRHGSTQLPADRDLTDEEVSDQMDTDAERDVLMATGVFRFCPTCDVESVTRRDGSCAWCDSPTSPCSPVLRSRSCVSHQRRGDEHTTTEEKAA